MSKLSKDSKFFDVSDYGRPIANFFTRFLKDTFVTPIHVTFTFGICGLLAIYEILHNNFFLAALFLILKSIIDAMDGELARLNQRPTYTGRYLDSIFDIILNFFILSAIGFVAQQSIWLILLAFFAIQLQGTLYNYYYVILRNNSEGGDTTSQVFEKQIPIAFPSENQRTVNILYKTYSVLYGIFDNIIYKLDYSAHTTRNLPNWFMTAVSFLGLGFQLVSIATMLVLGFTSYILPYFVISTVYVFVLIIVRRTVLS